MDIQFHLPAIAARYFFAAVIAADLLFVFMTAASDIGWTFIHPVIARQFDLKNEGVLAVWYSSTLLSLNCVACVLVACNHSAGKLWRMAWLGVALGFLTLSADETAQIHEVVGEQIAKRGYGASFVPSHGLAFGWLIPAVPICGAFCAVLLVAMRSWAADHPRSRKFALAGLACWIGVLVAEFVESQMVRDKIGRSLQGVTEEGLELAGSSLFLVALIDSLRTRPQAEEDHRPKQPELS